MKVNFRQQKTILTARIHLASIYIQDTGTEKISLSHKPFTQRTNQLPRRLAHKLPYRFFCPNSPRPLISKFPIKSFVQTPQEFPVLCPTEAVSCTRIRNRIPNHVSVSAFYDTETRQGCGNTMPDLSDLIPCHSGQVENFYLLVHGHLQNFYVLS